MCSTSTRRCSCSSRRTCPRGGALGRRLAGRLATKMFLGTSSPSSTPDRGGPTRHLAVVSSLAVPIYAFNGVGAQLVSLALGYASPGRSADDRRVARRGYGRTPARRGRRVLLGASPRCAPASTPTTTASLRPARSSTSRARSRSSSRSPRSRDPLVAWSSLPMDDRPRNLRAMLSEAKDTSELMVDLAYAALYFGDPDMAEEVGELEDQLNELVHDMRAVCVLAARPPARGRGDGVGAPGHRRHRAHRQRRRRHRPHRHPPPRHPPRAGGRPVERRGGLAPRARPRGLAHGPPPARRARAAGRRPACASWPSAASATGSPTSTATTSCSPATCCSSRARRPASPGCASWPRRPDWEPPRAARGRHASPTSTAPSTCSSR